MSSPSWGSKMPFPFRSSLMKSRCPSQSLSSRRTPSHPPGGVRRPSPSRSSPGSRMPLWLKSSKTSKAPSPSRSSRSWLAMMTTGGWGGSTVEGQPAAYGSPQPPGPSPGTSIRYSGCPSPSRSPIGLNQSDCLMPPLLFRSPEPRRKKKARGDPPSPLTTTGRAVPDPLLIGFESSGGQVASADRIEIGTRMRVARRIGMMRSGRSGCGRMSGLLIDRIALRRSNCSDLFRVYPRPSDRASIVRDALL